MEDILRFALGAYCLFGLTSSAVAMLRADREQRTFITILNQITSAIYLTALAYTWGLI